MNKEEMLLKIQAKKQQRDQALEATKIAEEEKFQQDLKRLKTYDSRIKDLIDIAESIRKNGFYNYIERYGNPNNGCLGFYTKNCGIPIQYIMIGGAEITNIPRIVIDPDGTCRAYSSRNNETQVPKHALNAFFNNFDSFEKAIYKIVEDFF